VLFWHYWRPCFFCKVNAIEIAALKGEVA
jgi:hypothetical protein